jgi:CheY-like chemotaxis protein
MDIRRLSDADKYMLYGLLLRKRRPADAELRVLEIMRAPLTLDQKIDAVLALHRELPGSSPEEEEQTAELLRPGYGAGLRPGYPGRRKRKLRAVVADPYPEVTRLLSKCSLRWDLDFVQGENARQALYLVRKLRARLLVCNLPMPPEEREGFAGECRKRQSRIRLIFLAAPAPGQKALEAGLPGLYRILPKPINLNQLSEAVRELLEA